MQERQQFNQSDSQPQILQLSDHNKFPVSVLKHITAARKILDGQNKVYQIFSPRCLYPEELTRTNKYIMPKIEESGKLVLNRLISIEDAVFEFGRLKQQIKDNHSKVDKECNNTLWDAYSEKDIYYSRFEPLQKKHNFANYFMNVGGTNLEPKGKINNFPQIKNKIGGQINKNNNGSLIFDSHFQSGNLLYVYKNNDQKNIIETYDLILQNDINTRGHNQWFYFKITNTKKNQKVKINIVNLVKKESLFSYGLKPMTFSEKNSKNGLSWIRNGQKIIYEENHIKRQNKNQPLYTLSFEYQFREAYDSVYFAPSHPYVYSQLLYFMDNILTDKKYHNFISIKKLCDSIGKNAINLITISTGKQSIKDSKIIWILARQHPVETTSSYMVEGIINYLLELMSKESINPNSFYHNYIFKIIPMVNPDGVIHGNTRAELTGIDPNRVWKKPSKTITPSIYYIKKQIQKSISQTCMVLDLHSHSKKLGCFFYGNHTQNDIKSFRFLPSTICKNDNRFCYRNCRFRGGNQNSARRSLFHELNIPNIFTVQCSLLGYLKDNRINEFKISDYHEMGVKIIQSFFEVEKQKYTNMVFEIKEYPHENDDCCDAQSARSDSCVTESEYPQVYNFARPKKKLKGTVKNPKPRSNTFIYTHKNNISDLNNLRKIENSTKKVKDDYKSEANINNEQQKQKTIPVKQTIIDHIKNDKRQFSIKMRNTKNIKQMKNISNLKKYAISIKEQVDLVDQNRTYGEKSIQVEQLRASNENIDQMAKIKTEKRLIIVGNAVEEDKLYIGKNQVGIQMDNTLKQNLNQFAEQQNKQQRTNSNKFALKGNRRITQLNDIIRLDRSLKQQKKGVLLFRN